MTNVGWPVICAEVVPACIEELFESCGIAATYAGPELSDDARTSGIVATIGFTSEHLKGTLTLSTTEAVIVSAGALSASERDVMDCAGELANQALGRLKNKLLRYDVRLIMTTPIAITGMRLHARAARGGHSYHAFVTSFGTVDVQLGATVDEDFIWTEATSTAEPTASEGDFLML